MCPRAPVSATNPQGHKGAREVGGCTRGTHPHPVSPNRTGQITSKVIAHFELLEDAE